MDLTKPELAVLLVLIVLFNFFFKCCYRYFRLSHSDLGHQTEQDVLSR